VALLLGLALLLRPASWRWGRRRTMLVTAAYALPSDDPLRRRATARCRGRDRSAFALAAALRTRGRRRVSAYPPSLPFYLQRHIYVARRQAAS